MRKLGLLLALVLPLSTPAGADDAWELWRAHDPASTATVDHGAWDRFVARYVESGNRIAYGSVIAEDRARLDKYLDRLSGTPVRELSRAVQKAFWINLYNAATVQTILDHYPVESIRDIDTSPGLFADGPWGAPVIEIAGEEITLDDIEHRILRPIFGDPRIHYAVNCASVSCPELRAEAYVGDRIETQLDDQARRFINGPGVRVDGDEFEVSKIFDWFDEDFGDLAHHLARYAEPELKTRLQTAPDIGFFDYDWGLNASGE